MFPIWKSNFWGASSRRSINWTAIATHMYMSVHWANIDPWAASGRPKIEKGFFVHYYQVNAIKYKTANGIMLENIQE